MDAVPRDASIVAIADSPQDLLETLSPILDTTIDCQLLVHKLRELDTLFLGEPKLRQTMRDAQVAYVMSSYGGLLDDAVLLLNDKSLSKANKQLRLTELSCIIPESIRIILFFWMIQNKSRDLNEFYYYGIFSLNDNGYSFLEIGRAHV